MERIEVYFGLGSNMGDREIMLMRAVNLMDEAFGTHPERISRIVESQAQGFDGLPFLNMCLLYRLPRQGTPRQHATDILRCIKEIERSLGRSDSSEFAPDGTRIYHNRPIDIDILYYGNEKIETEALTIPHPKIAERDFVKTPLKEISKPALRSAFPEIFE
ncbi:MAG: 2-amino-4-hydroxy-6-hydroxymethyldihydropteridine diphosphokinase [Bacteroidales bacterium]|nr:2-amino-4-hydroxy-6-hydroxymethyldihydropteridine diphosphokinase [Bacteroidales bacterium]